MANEAVEMGEIEEVHQQEDNAVLNGDVSASEDDNSSSSVSAKGTAQGGDEAMEIGDDAASVSGESEEEEGDGEVVDENEGTAEESEATAEDNVEDGDDEEIDDDEGKDDDVVSSKGDVGEDSDKDALDKNGDEEPSDDDDDDRKSSDSKVNGSNSKADELEVHEIIDDDEEEDADSVKNGDDKNNETIELNDSEAGDEDEDDDEEGDEVMIIDDGTPKENGTTIEKRRRSSELEVIELDTTPVKKKAKKITDGGTPRRSGRNLSKSARSYKDDEDDEEPVRHHDHNSSEESDIEEIAPEDPLAFNSDKLEVRKVVKPASSTSNSGSGSTIVVKDTKRLVEIAAKSNNSPGGNKKEPTLVIIDTNSILSGRGPVPMNKSSGSGNSQSSNNYPPILPMALPAQGMYPANMRATITPIPMTSSPTPAKPSPTPAKSSPSISAMAAAAAAASSISTSHSQANVTVLPTLTDDMFVVEAPSFIVPYVYEKPPVTEFKNFLKDVKEQILKQVEEQQKKEKEQQKKAGGDDDDDDEAMETDDVKDDGEKVDLKDPDFDPLGDPKKPYSYFESPLGKFFMDIGFNQVQEYVQSDLLRQQKRKRDREGGQNASTNKTIHSLLKNLEYSKENNEHFKSPLKKCEYCNFKTESLLAMANHLETPHTKNYMYKCNFCAYEVRSPHDILFHMEAEHAVRGRLERAPAFHQCPNCPFEDNQKGKLSRHLVACMRKFKPEKNLEAPVDWEPPAKIPRVPKSRQGINVSAYQAMKSSQQLNFLSKMQLLNTNHQQQQQQQQHPMHRGRGRPTMPVTTPTLKGATMMGRASNMVYKQAMAGGSVLVPTNYQLSGNQVYQVVGGQELGGRLGHPGHMAFVSNMPSACSTVTIQQQNQQKNKMHQPSISITPLPRASATPSANMTSTKPGDTNSKNSFVICEICDGYIKDLEQLRNHMQWIHKVKIHPKMIYNRPPLNCQKCQFRFFTDQGLERHLLGSHGLVTSSMQDAANKSKDAGRCPVCGRVYQWKLLNHVARDHSMTLKPAHLSYKCTVCTATFGMYKQFENHVYSAHSVVAKRVMDKKAPPAAKSTGGESLMKPLKINDEITIIPQPAKASTSKEGSPATPRGSAGTSKNADSTTLSSAAENSDAKD